MSDIINQNTEPLFIFDMPDDETLSETISVKGEKGERGDPTKLSQLDNDTGFITKDVSNLTNYYDKTATDAKLDGKLDKSTFNAYEIPTDFFTAAETVSGTGSSITLANTSGATFKSLTIKGNTSQDGTPTSAAPVDINTATGLQTITITGDETRTYELDLGDMEVCGIGDYVDYFYDADNTWYLHKAISKKTFVEGDAKGKGSTKTSGRSRWYLACGDNLNSTTNDDVAVAYCTVAPAGTRNTTWQRIDSIACTLDNRFIIYLEETSQLASIAEMNAWLGENTPTVYYALEQAIDVPITDETLINQLNAIKAAKGGGSIQITASGTLAVILSVEAFTNKWAGTVSGLHADDAILSARVNKLDENVDDINSRIEEVEYIFPKNWGMTLSGDASLIKAYGKTILIDTHRAGNKTQLESMLTDHGVTHIDYLIITHYHDDHMGNVANLINDGYVTTSTEVYTPADCNMIDESEYLTGLKAQVIDALEGAGIDYHTPEEGETIELGDEWVLTFYNTDTDAINTWTNYNNGSIICKIKHGSSKILYTGDALGSALNRALANGFIDGHVDLYKVEHHGIEFDNAIPYVLETILPDYALQPSGQGDAQLNNYSISTTLGYLQSRGCKVYACHANSQDIVFASTINGVSVKAGKQSVSVSNNNDNGAFKVIYVDASTTNAVQDGTSAYPFKDLPQALGACERKGSGFIRIRLAAGEYCTMHSANVKNNPVFNDLDLDIASTSGDAADVIIRGKIVMRNSNVEISNCTFAPTGDERGTTLVASYTKLTLSNCIFDGSSAPTDPTMVWSSHSEITLDTCTISNYYLGISTHYDSVFAFNTSFENITLAAFYLRYADLRVKNNTYTNVASQVTRSTGGYMHGTPRVKLYEGTIMSGDISLNVPATAFNKLIIISGTVSGGTLLGDNVYSYNRNNFINGSAYNFRTLEDAAKITFSNGGTTATIARGANTPTLAIRGIYGVQEDISDDMSTPE